MEAEVAGAPLIVEGSGSAGTMVLERPGVVLDQEFEPTSGPPGPSLAVPSAALFGRGPEDADPGQTRADPPIWEVLAQWRAATRALAATELDTSAWYARHAELVGLRALYHALFDEAAAAAISPQRMVLVGPPRPADGEGVAVGESASAARAAVDNPEA